MQSPDLRNSNRLHRWVWQFAKCFPKRCQVGNYSRSVLLQFVANYQGAPNYQRCVAFVREQIQIAARRSQRSVHEGQLVNVKRGSDCGGKKV